MTTEDDRPHTVAIVTASATHPMQFKTRDSAVDAFIKIHRQQIEFYELVEKHPSAHGTTVIVDDFGGEVFFDRADFRSARLVDVAAEHEAANALRLIAGRAERNLEIAARSIAAAPPAQKFQL